MKTLVLFDIEETLIDTIDSCNIMANVSNLKKKVDNIKKTYNNVVFGIFSFAFEDKRDFNMQEKLENILNVKFQKDVLFFLEDADKAFRFKGLFFEKFEIPSIIGKTFSLIKMVESKVVSGFDKIILFDDSVETATFKTDSVTIDFVKV
jgi:hypothetical protein